MAGMRPFVDLGTGSFTYLAWSQITNEAAVGTTCRTAASTAPVTFHLLHGVRGGGAAQHSHSPQSMMCNAPGLEIVAPSNAADVYGLVRTALASPNPTVIVSHAKLLGHRERDGRTRTESRSDVPTSSGAAATSPSWRTR